ncbi:hypothetical protein BD289DRAFT_455683 [Coniella lustricola]|uniref:Uncharacterized protein n=1 Tax=Coniella lustricola TaxID=2025994 RepID=A0A2T2ZYV9_9PEZI|nr:hypothetical protein BD289DRAFT_455683 [Coniella lustricola]
MSRPGDVTSLIRPRRRNSPPDPESGYGSMASVGPSGSRVYQAGRSPPRHGHQPSNTLQYDDDDNDNDDGDNSHDANTHPPLPALRSRLRTIFSHLSFSLSSRPVPASQLPYHTVTLSEVQEIMQQAHAALFHIVDLMKRHNWDAYYTEYAEGQGWLMQTRYELLMDLAGKMSSGPNFLTRLLQMDSVAVSTGKRRVLMPGEAYKAALKLRRDLEDVGRDEAAFEPAVSGPVPTPATTPTSATARSGEEVEEDEETRNKNAEKREVIWTKIGTAFDEFLNAMKDVVEEAEKVNKVYQKILGKRFWNIAAWIVPGTVSLVVARVVLGDWRTAFLRGRYGGGIWDGGSGQPGHRRGDDGDDGDDHHHVDGYDDDDYNQRYDGRTWSRSPSPLRRHARPLPHDASSDYPRRQRSAYEEISSNDEDDNDNIWTRPTEPRSGPRSQSPHDWARSQQQQQQQQQQGRFVGVSAPSLSSSSSYGSGTAGGTSIHDSRARVGDGRYSTSGGGNGGGESSSLHLRDDHQQQNRAHRRSDSSRVIAREARDGYESGHTGARARQHQHREHRQQPQQRTQRPCAQHHTTSTGTSTSTTSREPHSIYDLDLHLHNLYHPPRPHSPPYHQTDTYCSQDNSILGTIEDEDLLARSRRTSDVAVAALDAATQAADATSSATAWGASPTRFGETAAGFTPRR